MKILKLTFSTLLIIAIFASCKKEVSLEGGNITAAGGTWKFQQSTVQYNGNIDSSFIRGSGATKFLTIVGKSISGQESFSIQLNAIDSFIIGSYSASLSQSQFTYGTSAKTIFQGDFLAGEFIVNITSLSSNTITGTFSGEVEDSTGNVTTITLGSFVSTIDLSSNGTGGGVVTSVGTLGNSAGACTPITPSGVFTQGVALTASNAVQVEVNVTTPGTYIIATNSVNGVNFFKSGSFISTGPQAITLAGAGTPLSEGVQTYTITFGSSNCTFSMTFLPGAASTGNYFPLTLNSNWVYGLEGGSPTDSLVHKVINYVPPVSGQSYSTVTEESYPLSGTADDSLYFRKSGGNYYEYEDLGFAFNFDNPVLAEINFLKDNVPVNTSWQSQNISGTISGVAVTGYYVFTILEKSVPVTIGSKTFPDVIKVQAETFVDFAPGSPISTTENWFAKDVGIIHTDSNNGLSATTYEIGQYQVF